eukprot:122762-Chlamydomonas_euryale.AAC.6
MQLCALLPRRLPGPRAGCVWAVGLRRACALQHPGLQRVARRDRRRRALLPRGHPDSVDAAASARRRLLPVRAGDAAGHDAGGGAAGVNVWGDCCLA